MVKLPARYDHVGSFLRPAYLLEAREQKAKGDQFTPCCSRAKSSVLVLDL